MGTRYLTKRPGRNGLPRYFWQPSSALRAKGFRPERVPLDWASYTDATALETAAIARATALTSELDRARAAGQDDLIVPHSSKARARRVRGPEIGGRRFIYVIGHQTTMQKIGISVDPIARCAALQTGQGTELHLWFMAAGRHAFAPRAERLAHQRLAHLRREGEWFQCQPSVAITAVLEVLLELSRLDPKE